jgi:cysteine desulfurase/selenocysteine lyase
MEHHSNIVPWLRLKEELGVKLFYVPINKNWELDYKLMSGLPRGKVKLVALTLASNVLGTINPITEIVNWLTSNKVRAKVLVDAAQAVPHIPVRVGELGCDWLAWSGHKMLGPSGVGGLWAKKEILEEMEPMLVGSHMINRVTSDKATWAEVPDKFEVGTGRLEAVAGLGAAVDYLNDLGWKRINRIELELTEYILNKINEISDIEIFGKKDTKDRLGVISFNIDGIHAHDVAEILNRWQICVRSGHHCAQPLMGVLGVPATVRASLYIYNTKEDIDKLISGIMEVKKIFNKISKS